MKKSVVVGRGSYLPRDGNWKRFGLEIGNNTIVKHLKFDERGVFFTPQDIIDFFTGVAKSKSLTTLTVNVLYPIFNHISKQDLFTTLLPLFKLGKLQKAFINCNGNGEPGEHRSLLSSLSQFNTLKELRLQWLNISDNVTRDLISILRGHCSLKMLDLKGNRIKNRGVSELAVWLDDPRCALKELSLSANSDFGPSELDILAAGLKRNRTVKAIRLDRVNIKTRGWKSLWSVWKDGSQSNLERISIQRNDIKADVLVDLFHVLAGRMKLKSLNIAHNRNITLKGWQALATHLQSPHCILEFLYLNDMNINDDVLAMIARCLGDNKTLKRLFFRCEHSVTEVGLSELERALCNKASIPETYYSNHTLVGLYSSVFERTGLLTNLSIYLGINKNNNSADAARLKIIKTHFSGGLVVQPFLHMEIGLMPHVLAWMGRDCDVSMENWSLLHEFVGGSPQIFGFVGREEKGVASSKKREACEMYSRPPRKKIMK